MTINTSRRGFLKGAAAAGAVLLVGARPDGSLAATTTESAQFNPFVKIDADGTVTAIVKHFEMGQGPATGLPTLIAEEIGLRMDQIAYEFAPSNAHVYANLAFGQHKAPAGRPPWQTLGNNTVRPEPQRANVDQRSRSGLGRGCIGCDHRGGHRQSGRQVGTDC